MSTMIPFLDLKAAYHELKPSIDDAVLESLDRAQYILGDEVFQFESSFGHYIGTEHCVTVGSGLDALVFSLKAVGVSAGDEVIVPAHTFIATWLAVTQLGAIPVPVDSDSDRYNISAKDIRPSITPKTKAVIVVSLYGEAAVDGHLRTLADEHGIPLIEDAAQAHGANKDGCRAGTLADIAAWSFYPGKNLGAMDDGGAVTTNSADLADKVRLFRNYGSKTKYQHQTIGSNSRLGSIQAAILQVKLGILDEWNERRGRIADCYLNNISNSSLLLPSKPIDGVHVWHLFVIQHPERDKLQVYLSENGVTTVIHYPTPPHLQPCYSELEYDRNSFPVASSLAETVLSLPIGPHLPMEHAQQITTLLNQF